MDMKDRKIDRYWFDVEYDHKKNKLVSRSTLSWWRALEIEGFSKEEAEALKNMFDFWDMFKEDPTNAHKTKVQNAIRTRLIKMLKENRKEIREL